MADEQHMKMIAELEFRASGTPAIASLQAKINKLKDQIQKSFAKNAITTPIVSPQVMKDLQGAGKAINGLTKKYTDMAKEARELGQMNARVWAGMRRDLQGHVRAWQKANGEEKKSLGESLREKVKYHQAYRSIYNKEHGRYLKAVEQLGVSEGNLRAAQWRRDQRMDAQRRAAALRSRAAFAQSMRTVAGSVRSGAFQAGLVGGALAYGTGRAVSSSIRSATDMDRAEANARINMDEKDLPGGFAGLRERILPKSVQLGQDPARYMQTVVEAAKAGVPERMSEQTGEMVTMLAKTFGVEVDQAMDGMGYAIAQEFGAGRLKDIGGVRRLGNIAAFLAAKTAARPDQMFSFLRTGMGSGAMLGMNQQSTLAFGASAIQAGAQGQQAARFLGSLGETLAELTMESNQITKKHHRSEKDRLFMSLPGQLGYGSYGEIEQQIKKNPNDAIFKLISSFQKIKQPLDRQKAMSAMFGADFGRFLANMIASPEMLKRTKELAEQAAGQKEGNDFISEAWDEYSKSLEFLMSRISATWKVLKTELGSTFKPFVEQLSLYVSDWYSAVKTGGLKDKLTAVLNGLTEGFLGKAGTFRDLLEKMFGKPGDGSMGNTESWFKFARGFATGLREVGEMISNIMSKLANYFGSNGDAEAMGRFTAKIIALVGALVILGPVISVLSSFVTLMGALGAILGTPALAAGIATALQNTGVSKSRIREKGESYEHWQKRIVDDKKARYQLQSGSGFNPADVHPMNYLGDKLDKFGGKIERAGLMSTDFSAMRRGGGLGYAYEGAGSSGSGGGGGSGMRLLSGVGTPDALIKNVTPGGALPNFGVGSGGIIRRGGVGGAGGVGTSIPDGGPADMSVGQGLSGNGFLQARREKFGKELENDPNLRLHLAAMQMTEGASRGGTIESLMNRSDMQGKSMRQMLGYSADGRINPRSFYGPIRRGELGPAIAKLRANPKLYQQYNAYTDRALAGSHVIGGYTDQGLPTDPNGSARTGIPGLRLRDPKTGKVDGNEFTDWAGAGRQKAINWRHFYEKGIAGSGNSPIGGVPAAADAIKNVPAAPQSGVPMRGGFDGGGRGSVAIHINGNSHDPEALATLVQRRVDEQMNWRTHDTESEYT
ncbi:phage tail tape measure protein [Bradyrhizobium pachyrhizi]|uniref:phage tail tape measure protein n=1 Tax=Bradyrhizobium pachyrhizi TaxID=280333 RepID=UPI0024B07EAD|nr:phage tail tape measure protein [Bradyrhizobium pachyrhizi]WFU52324.1 phage tail tape measure protein [Bradyrhizobium pachyrhizi]